ncbi:hypothetical protein O9H85_00790 [Paenibacillus filicis]|uniref:Uncharacterized protein n=1 Tax=Paenibacillus gyeongsangnamensis TaxID=3388067 RepID=A0ABT4Q282_9BACL|nr:hypothetical protein [Paenibacillus filicis]MCZ8510993.1 hypothetical protein [Paenibacillus filicis]
MEVHVVPSRWGGLVAGAPKVPSMFTARNPQTWILKEDGSPLYSKASGPASSVHHPEVKQFFRESLKTMLTEWPIKGIVWDEVKTLDVKDYSPESVKSLGNEPSMEQYTDAVSDFFDEMGAYCKQVQPNVKVSSRGRNLMVTFGNLARIRSPYRSLNLSIVSSNCDLKTSVTGSFM